MKNSKNSLSKSAVIFFSVLAAVFLKLFVIDLVKISGTSMEPCLKSGSYVFVSKLSYGIVKPLSSEFLWNIHWKSPSENQVVVFLHGDKMNVKRCVATEFTGIQFIENIENSSYYLNVNGKIIPLNNSQYEFLRQYLQVPEGMVLAVGDNYPSSIDSRNYGFVSCKNITGKVLCR